MKKREQNDSFVILDEDGNEDFNLNVRTPTPSHTPTLNQEILSKDFEDISATAALKSTTCQVLKNIIFRTSSKIASYCCTPTKEKQDIDLEITKEKKCLCYPW